jgi:hypothetical protein
MANTGNTFAGTGENTAGIGANAWTDTDNITADDAADATCTGAGGSNYLVARNFGFSIPEGSVIYGILVRVEASEHSGGVEPLLAQLQDSSAALFGASKSTSNEGSISGTTKAVYTYGSTNDTWSATLTPTIVNSANFGVRFWFTTTHDVRIDYVTMAIEHAIMAVPGLVQRIEPVRPIRMPLVGDFAQSMAETLPLQLSADMWTGSAAQVFHRIKMPPTWYGMPNDPQPTIPVPVVSVQRTQIVKKIEAVGY